MSFLFCFLIFFVVVALSFGVLSQCQSIGEWTNGGYSCNYGSPQLAEQAKTEGLSAALQSPSDTLKAPRNQEEEVPTLMEETPVPEETSNEPPQTTAPAEETPVWEESSEQLAPAEETPASEESSNEPPQTTAPAEETPVPEDSAGAEPIPAVGAQEQEKPTKAKASKTSRTVKPKKKTAA